MSFAFRRSRGDMESGFSDYHPVWKGAILVVFFPSACPSSSTVILLFMILNSPQMSHFLMWLMLVVFVMATSLRMFVTWQQLQAQARAHAAPAELQLHVPPSIAIATRGRLQGLRLQLALLDREFDDLYNETLRALESDPASNTTSMTDEEINALPVHTYKVPVPTKDVSAGLASSSCVTEVKQENGGTEGKVKGTEEALTCTICLGQVNKGERLVRNLPCLHQFHTSCIDPWSRQQAKCPVCKFRMGSGWQRNRGGTESDGLDIV